MELIISDEVSKALHDEAAVVALESTVIAQGLPYPQNLETALALETIVREEGGTPATIAVLKGELCVGLSKQQIEYLATSQDIRKISRRDLAIAVAKRLDCATTVASTTFIAHRAGIKVFATGGIGGVHRGGVADVSADLPELASTPMIVVCSGAKIVLDLPATREWLETNGVAVLGWQCSEMPAFYSIASGLAVDERIDTPHEAASIARARDKLEINNAVLVAVPVPAEFAMDRDELKTMINELLVDAANDHVSGKDITPYLLAKMSERSGGRTLAANIALLKNNTRVAAKIALALSTTN